MTWDVRIWWESLPLHLLGFNGLTLVVGARHYSELLFERGMLGACFVWVEDIWRAMEGWECQSPWRGAGQAGLRCLPSFLLAVMFGTLAIVEWLFSHSDRTLAHVMHNSDGLTPGARPTYTLQYLEFNINVPILFILSGRLAWVGWVVTKCGGQIHVRTLGDELMEKSIC